MGYGHPLRRPRCAGSIEENGYLGVRSFAGPGLEGRQGAVQGHRNGREAGSGKPLYERVVTVTGPGIKNPSNFLVRIGTPISVLIEAAGGRNACRIQSVRNPVVSPEGIIWLDPDVIVELARPDAMQRYNREEIIGDWDELPQVKAVKHGRVLVYDKSFACVPGPRFIHFLQVLARDLHPELDWYGEDP